MNTLLAIPDASHVAAARRAIEKAAKGIGFGDDDRGRATLIATELGTNLARHGKGGEILLRSVQADAGPGLELIALDRGPGIDNVAERLRDGSSTYGSSGTGLGAIRRQSDDFDIYSRPTSGTVVLARLWPQRRHPPERGWQVGSVSVAKAEEPVCGDSLGVLRAGMTAAAMVADGLGHGLAANTASEEARRLFCDAFPASATAAIQKIHAGLRATRGAAVGVAMVDFAANRVTFCGIGNIAGLAASGGNVRRFVSMNGIAGHTAGRIQEFIYPCDGEGLVIVLHSDGLSGNWSLDRYGVLAGHHPSLIAALLFRDAGRRRDDATVLVLKRAP
jgi:anti-sigma regulatory factor (Ser/Thr protein kinase)